MWKTYDDAKLAMERDGWRVVRGLYTFGKDNLRCELEWDDDGGYSPGQVYAL